MMAKRKAKTKRAKKARASADAEIMAAVRRVGFRTYRAYVVARSRLPLREMAVELGVAESTFLNHHATWVKANAPAPTVEV